MSDGVPVSLEDVLRAVLVVVEKLNDHSQAYAKWDVLNRAPEIAVPDLGTVEDAWAAANSSYYALQDAIAEAEPLVRTIENQLSAAHGAAGVRDLGIEANCWHLWVLKCAREEAEPSARRPWAGIGIRPFGARGAGEAPWIDVETITGRLRNEVREAVRIKRQKEAGETVGTTTDSKTVDTILSHGDRSYSAGNTEPFTVTEREDAVLQAFLNRSSLDTRNLIRKAGPETSPAVLRNLTRKYDGVLAPFIVLPGRKNNGGYKVRIRRAE